MPLAKAEEFMKSLRVGHRSIQHTTRYTQLSAAPFKDFWR
jgi:hypothetical protein